MLNRFQEKIRHIYEDTNNLERFGKLQGDYPNFCV